MFDSRHGDVLATLDIEASKDKVYRLEEKGFQGKKWLSIRVWKRGKTGNFWPTKNGMMVAFEDFETVILPGLIAFKRDHTS